jgi:hypothetical protein
LPKPINGAILFLRQSDVHFIDFAIKTTLKVEPESDSGCVSAPVRTAVEILIQPLGAAQRLGEPEVNERGLIAFNVYSNLQANPACACVFYGILEGTLDAAHTASRLVFNHLPANIIHIFTYISSHQNVKSFSEMLFPLATHLWERNFSLKEVIWSEIDFN